MPYFESATLACAVVRALETAALAAVATGDALTAMQLAVLAFGMREPHQ